MTMSIVSTIAYSSMNTSAIDVAPIRCFALPQRLCLRILVGPQRIGACLAIFQREPEIGTFRPDRVCETLDGAPFALASADFNRDGKADLVVSTYVRLN